MHLNESAAELCERLIAAAQRLRVGVHASQGGGTILDFGIQAVGGLEAGRRLAEICLAGLGEVRFVPQSGGARSAPAVAVWTDQPVAACMASQYAGWQISHEGFFAMGSGPMRAAAGVESLLEQIHSREQSQRIVGVLETRIWPTPAVFDQIAKACGVSPADVTLLVAPTASQAGTVQVVARSIETALHKLHELGFDLGRVESGWGVAPLPPVAANDLAAIGRTNDAILYGGEVTLWVRGDDDSLEAVGPSVPSSSSRDFGEPFAAIFERYGKKFYDIDPHLFSPAAVMFCNLDTGRTHRFGEPAPDIVAKSFAQ